MKTFLKTAVYICIYIQPFSKTFSYGEIYRYIYTFVFLHVRPWAFFTCHCPTCEKTRFNDKFFLRRVFLFQFEKNISFCVFVFRKNACALQYKFAMTNYIADFGNEKNIPRSSRVIWGHRMVGQMPWHL